MGLMLLCFQPLHAKTKTGNDFVREWKEYKKSEDGGSGEFFKIGIYMGYVNGISDSYNGLLFQLPEDSTLGQSCSVVGKWIDNHPEKWAESPLGITVTALQEAFPLPKKR